MGKGRNMRNEEDMTKDMMRRERRRENKAGDGFDPDRFALVRTFWWL